LVDRRAKERERRKAAALLVVAARPRDEIADLRGEAVPDAMAVGTALHFGSGGG
jgi:hypothetical protein